MPAGPDDGQAAVQALLKVIVEQRPVKVPTSFLHELNLGPGWAPLASAATLQSQDKVREMDIRKRRAEGLPRRFAAG